jgi:hypothetical protein
MIRTSPGNGISAQFERSRDLQLAEEPFGRCHSERSEESRSEVLPSLRSRNDIDAGFSSGLPARNQGRLKAARLGQGFRAADVFHLLSRPAESNTQADST